MKITTRISPINPNLLKVTVDVGMESLYAYTELPPQTNAAHCLEETIRAGIMTYDLARQMEGVKPVRCSAFGAEVAERIRQNAP